MIGLENLIKRGTENIENEFSNSKGAINSFRYTLTHGCSFQKV